MSVLTVDGKGGFATEVRYTVGAQPVSLIAADLNGDGRLDLVSANVGGDSISVLIGKGDGTFL